MPSKSAKSALVTFLAAAGCLAFAGPAAADDLTVTTTADSGAGSLREAVILANADFDADRILFSVSGEISLLTPIPKLREVLAIEGPGSRNLTVRRSGVTPSMRVFDIHEDATVSIDGLTVANGYTNFGANIASEGDLTLNGVTVTGGFAESGASSEAYGGGIYNAGDGRMTIRNSTISGNRARNPEFTRGGGIANAAEMLIVNSTITGNLASSINNAAPGIQGGGLLLVDGKATLRGVTVAGNESRRLTLPGYGANISVMSGADLEVTSSIVADPILGESCYSTSTSTIISGGFNLADSGGCGFAAATDKVGEPGLGPLADNGGPVDSMLPALGGPAIDAGFSGGEATDARGLTRVVDQGEIANPGDGADVGAVELPDTTAPETVISEAPKKAKAKSKRAKVRFGFSSNDSGASFECSLDGKAFAPCRTTHRAELKRGRHTIEVRATDATGLTDATPAKAKVKVKRKRK